MAKRKTKKKRKIYLSAKEIQAKLLRLHWQTGLHTIGMLDIEERWLVLYVGQAPGDVLVASVEKKLGKHTRVRFPNSRLF